MSTQLDHETLNSMLVDIIQQLEENNSTLHSNNVELRHQISSLNGQNYNLEEQLHYVLELLHQMAEIEVPQEPPEVDLLGGGASATSSMYAVAMPALQNFITNCQNEETSSPFLHTLVSRGLVDALQTVMTCVHEVDLRVRDVDGCTPLHLVFSVCPEDVAPLILQAILKRVSNTQLDTLVDWEGIGEELINTAVAYGRLWLLCEGIIPFVSYFYDKPRGYFQLRAAVMADDWNKISDTHRMYFVTIEHINEEHPAATQGLLEVCQSTCWHPTGDAFQKWVEAGADVMYRGPEMSRPILSELLWNEEASCVKMALSTMRCIDFTVEAVNNQTFLHFLALLTSSSHPNRSIPLETGVTLLNAVIDHIQDHPHEDRINWGQKTRRGNECISYAAFSGWLADWWNVVVSRGVEYYITHEGPICITQKVLKADWIKLSVQDQEKFILSVGFQD